MIEPTLFDAPTARMSDPETSYQAAEVAAKSARRHREIALLAHADHPEGLTDFELEALTGIKQTSIGKRRGELVAAKPHALVERAPVHPRRGPLNSSPAIVWRVTAAGIAAAGVLRRQETAA